MLKTLGLSVLALGVVAALANAGPLTGINLVANGDFELPAIGDNQPQMWDSFASGNPATWDGVEPWNYIGSQLPPVRSGGGAQAYGDAGEGRETGSIDQVIENEVRPFQKEIWVGLWVFRATHPYSPSGGVRINLDQGGTHWNSAWLGSTFTGSTFLWTWHEFLIPLDYGFVCDDITLTIEIDTGAVAIPGWGNWRGCWIDGVQLEDRCVPEPVTALLALPMLLLVRRRR